MARSMAHEFVQGLRQKLHLESPSEDMGGSSMDLYNYLDELHAFYLRVPIMLLHEPSENKDQILTCIASLDTVMRREDPRRAVRIVSARTGSWLLGRALEALESAR